MPQFSRIHAILFQLPHLDFENILLELMHTATVRRDSKNFPRSLCYSLPDEPMQVSSL